MPNDKQFDFDLMSRLARDNPLEFARRRDELIRHAIASCEVPERARRTQWEIDSSRTALLEEEDDMGGQPWASISQLSALFVKAISTSWAGVDL